MSYERDIDGARRKNKQRGKKGRFCVEEDRHISSQKKKMFKKRRQEIDEQECENQWKDDLEDYS